MTRQALTVALIASTFIALITGCSGPGTQGVQARSAAQERVSMVNAQVSYDQARRSFETGDLERALREIGNAIARYPEIYQYHLLRGRILIERHRLEAAMQSLEAAIEFNEDAAEPRYYAGIVYQRWSNHERALEQYLAASERDEANVQYLLAAAETHIALNDYAAARNLIMPRLAYHEHNAALRHLLGHIAMLEGDPARSADMLREARLLNPDDSMLLEELAWAQFKAGRYSASYDTIQELYRVLGLSNMGSVESHRYRQDLRQLEARTLTRLDRLSEARRVYIELSQRVPNKVDVWIELGAVSLALGDDRRVETSTVRAMSMAPERHEGYLLRAVYERERGNIEAAEDLLNKAIERAPERKMPHLLLGRLLEEAGELHAAKTSYGEALRIDPDSHEANVLFGRIRDRIEISSVNVQ